MNFKRFSVLLNLLSYAPLLLPIYSTSIDSGEAYELTIKGYNLAEFSVWGSIIFAIPIIIIAITYSSQDNKIKNLLLIATYLLGVVGYYNSSTAADKWIRGVADGFVLCRPYQMISFVFIFASMICSFVYINQRIKKCDNELEENECYE